MTKDKTIDVPKATSRALDLRKISTRPEDEDLNDAIKAMEDYINSLSRDELIAMAKKASTTTKVSIDDIDAQHTHTEDAAKD